MANIQDKFSAEDVTSGVNTQGGDFSSEYALGPDSQNLTTGINQGVGPRPGMSPIPGHSNLDVPTAASLGGLRFSEEDNSSTTFQKRRKFLGLIPLANGKYDDLTVRGNQFIWLVTDDDGDLNTLNAVSSSEFVDNSPSPNEYKYQFDPAYGLNVNLWQQPDYDATNAMKGWNSPIISRVSTPNSASVSPNEATQSYLQIPNRFWCSTAKIAVSGASWAQQWLIGKKITNGTTDTTATANFIKIFDYVPMTDVPYTTGISPSWNLRNFKKSNRPLTFWNMGASVLTTFGQLMRKYVYGNYPVDDSTFIETFNQDYTTSNISISGTGSAIEPERTYVFDPDDVDMVLMNDPDGVCDSSYRAVLVAAQKPFAFLIQDWQRDNSGNNIQIAGLTDRDNLPRTIATLDGTPGAGGAFYTENGVQVNTCFQYWPAFDETTALTEWTPGAPNNAPQVCLNDVAGTGILRANSVYEFTFSVFDKQLGIESNVGAPAKVRTGDKDFISVSLFHDVKTGTGEWEQMGACGSGQVGNTTSPIWVNYWGKTASGEPTLYNNINANYLELRFYYREIGTNQWLPALFVDYTKYLFYPDFQILWACVGDVAGLPGGAPGQFNDYSQLPDDQYDCVLSFQSRVFWFSQKNMVFSLRNNIFAYPLRNSAPAPTGGYKGAIIHTYRGQSEQSSRLVIFGETETYIGKFTGNFQQMPVVISPDTIASYDLDGSDFTIETWTSITAFSYRSAVVADGDLYFWGPDGIFIDNGVTNPLRISDAIEPNIFSLYDEALVNEIHAVYDNKAKEIVWFYPPADDNTISHGLRYNIETEEFFFDTYTCKVDWAARVATNNTEQITQKTNATRTIAAIREDSAATVQRGVFYDQINRSGDYDPTKELLVKSIAPGSVARELIFGLDTGIDPAVLATIDVGDYIAVQQFRRYTGAGVGDDLIAKVLAVDVPGSEITVNIPQGANLPSIVFGDQKNFFPVWHKAKSGVGLNGFPWSIATKYWAPLGPNYFGIFNYIYMLFKYVPWFKIDPTNFTLSYRTPSTNRSAMISDTVPWANNSDFNSQIMHALRPGNSGLVDGPFGNNQGQALKFALSGVHIGEEWVLQYLEMQADAQDGNLLKQYQA